MWHELGIIFAHLLMMVGAIVAVLLLFGVVLLLILLYDIEIKHLFEDLRNPNLKENKHEEPASNRQDR